MSDHSDAPNPRADITDLFVFSQPDDGAGSVLVLNINPAAAERDVNVDPDVSYEIKIDTDGDLEPDVAFHIRFGVRSPSDQTATVYRSSGLLARESGPVGEVAIAGTVSTEGSVAVTAVDGYRFFAGLRSDPWFADVDGFLNDMRFTGHDTFGDRNVFGIVLGLPNAMLGSAGTVRIWARTVVREHGEDVQVDQVGRPLVNAVFNRTEPEQAAMNETPPSRQVARFCDQFVRLLQGFGYSEPDAMRLATEFLPDVLPFDPSLPAGYPNGRRLTDDIADLRAALVTQSKVTTDLVGPHTDLLDDFPYLAPPHPVQ